MEEYNRYTRRDVGVTIKWEGRASRFYRMILGASNRGYSPSTWAAFEKFREAYLAIADTFLDTGIQIEHVLPHYSEYCFSVYQDERLPFPVWDMAFARESQGWQPPPGGHVHVNLRGWVCRICEPEKYANLPTKPTPWYKEMPIKQSYE